MSMRILTMSMTATALLAGSAPAADAPADGQFEHRYRTAAQSMLRSLADHGDQTYACPAFDPKFANSAHVDRRQWIADHTEKLEFTGPNRMWIEGQPLVPPTAEVDAVCNVIPDLAVGAYGTIHSGRIARVVEGKGFVLSNIQLVDEAAMEKQLAQDKLVYDAWVQEVREKAWQENQTRWRSGKPPVRGVGWDGYITKGKQVIDNRYGQRRKLVHQQNKLADVRVLVLSPVYASTQPGRDWIGTKQPLAIVDVIEDPAAKGESLLVALPITHLRRGVSIDRFTELLAEGEMTREQFVQRVDQLHAKQTDGVTLRTTILREIHLYDAPSGKAAEPTLGELLDEFKAEGESNRRAFKQARREADRRRQIED